MNRIDFSVENKLPLPAILFLMISSIKRLVKEFWALGIIFFLQDWNNGARFWLKILIAIAVILGFAVIRGILLYRNFLYVVRDNQVIVKKGILKKTVLNIPLHRIQNVSITQGFWQQLLGISTFSIDTLGTDDKEMEIYLDVPTSNLLKEHLKSGYAEVTEDEQNQILHTEEIPPKTVYAYTDTRLFIAATTRNHLKGFALFLILTYTFLSQFSKSVLEKVLTSVEPIIKANHTVWYWTFVAVSVIILAIVINIGYTFLKYYKLNIKLYDENIKYEAGLIKKIEKIIRYNKIQIIKETSNLLEKIAGVKSIKILQFLSFGKSKNEVEFSLPGFWNSQEFIRSVYVGIDSEVFSTFYPRRNYLFRNFYLLGVYPALIIGVFAFFDWRVLFFSVFWFIMGILFALLRFQKSKSEIGNEYMRVSSGTIGNTTQTIKIKNIESLTLRQSVFQARKQTASVVVATRWNNITIPFINEDEAKAIYNYLLYKVES